MKIWILGVLVVCAATVSEAAKGDATKEKFMATQKAQYEKKGWPWNQEKVEAMFKAIDTNSDGIASGEEKKAYWEAQKNGSSATAPKAAAPAKKLAKGDSTLEMFLATQKAQKEKKGIEWNQKKMEKMFEQMDLDGDGIVTGSEKKAYWNK